MQTYVYTPRSLFLEFISEQDFDKEDPPAKSLNEIEVGKDYELVITTYGGTLIIAGYPHNLGLVRYRFGDVVKVVRFHNKLPVFEFLYRQGLNTGLALLTFTGQVLDLRGEKTAEIAIFRAWQETLKTTKVELVDYTCTHHAFLNCEKIR